MVALMKCLPWSVVKLRGQPNLEILFSKRNLEAVWVLQSLVGDASAHLVR